MAHGESINTELNEINLKEKDKDSEFERDGQSNINQCPMTTQIDSNTFQKQIEEAMQQFLGPENAKAVYEELENLTQQTLKMEGTNIDDGNSNKIPSDFASAISETLNNMKINDSPTDFQSIMSKISERGVLKNITETLLSKEVVFPSLMELNKKYPIWLLENKKNLTQAELNRYTKQSSIIAQLVAVYEEESETDTNDTKKERFEKLTILMHDMQACGQPPKEIIGSVCSETQE